MYKTTSIDTMSLHVATNTVAVVVTAAVDFVAAAVWGAGTGGPSLTV